MSKVQSTDEFFNQPEKREQPCIKQAFTDLNSHRDHYKKQLALSVSGPVVVHNRSIVLGNSQTQAIPTHHKQSWITNITGDMKKHKTSKANLNVKSLFKSANGSKTSSGRHKTNLKSGKKSEKSTLPHPMLKDFINSNMFNNEFNMSHNHNHHLFSMSTSNELSLTQNTKNKRNKGKLKKSESVKIKNDGPTGAKNR